MKPLFVTVRDGKAQEAKNAWVSDTNCIQGEYCVYIEPLWFDCIGSEVKPESGAVPLILSAEDAEAYRAIVDSGQMRIDAILKERQKMLDLFARNARPVRREDVV